MISFIFMTRGSEELVSLRLAHLMIYSVVWYNGSDFMLNTTEIFEHVGA